MPKTGATGKGLEEISHLSSIKRTFDNSGKPPFEVFERVTGRVGRGLSGLRWNAYRLSGFGLKTLVVRPFLFPGRLLDENRGRLTLKLERTMNLKVIKNSRGSAYFRILTTVGAVGLLCPSLFTARGDTTNTTETSRSPIADSSATEIFGSGITATPEILLPASEPVTSAPDANAPLNATADLMPEILVVSTNVLTEGPTGFAMIGILSDSSPLPAIEGTAPVFRPNVLGLPEAGGQLLNKPLPWAEVSLGWGQLLLQFFAPRSYPAPPGRPLQPDWDESDRPWPVMATGAATGTSWNEPGTYQAQGFLSFCW